MPSTPTTGSTVRDATPGDFPAILELNLASVSFLSPLCLQGLEELHAQAWYHRVAGRAGRPEAFLLALAAGADYDSPNYCWFAQRHDDFVYVDRIVVSAAARQARLASALYEDLLARARAAGMARVCCEYDVEPPNEASRRFHDRFGFVEVGTQRVGPQGKRVSLQQCLLGAARG